FTVTLSRNSGGGYGPVAGIPVTVGLTNANGAAFVTSANNCASGTDANGQCAITFVSQTPGTVTGHATATLPVDGRSITVATDGQADNGSDAVKTFVDANIQISPPAANNPISTNHTLTAHVNVNGGSGFTNAPSGTAVTFALTNAGGATAAFVGASSCTTAGTSGSCSVVIK